MAIRTALSRPRSVRLKCHPVRRFAAQVSDPAPPIQRCRSDGDTLTRLELGRHQAGRTAADRPGC